MSAEPTKPDPFFSGLYIFKDQYWVYVDDDEQGNALLWRLGSSRLEAAPKNLLRPIAALRGVSTNLRPLGDYPSRHQAEAMQRQAVIAVLLKSPPSKAIAIEAAKKLQVSVQTLERLIQRYVLCGYRASALVPRVGLFSNRNRLLDPVREEILQEAIDKYWLTNQKVRKSKLVEIINLVCREKGKKEINQCTIYARLKRLPPNEVTLAREGAKAARDTFRMNTGRLDHADRPLSEVQIDHTKCDIFVVLPDGRRVRPWITLAIDVYTRLILGLHLSLDEPSAYSVGMCLYRVMSPREDWLRTHGITTSWPCFGRPYKTISDNAKEFRGYSLQRIALDHDLIVEFREVDKPERGAFIESLMGRLALELEFFPGASFGSVARKKKYPAEAMASLTFSKLEAMLLHFFIEVYHHSAHSGLNGASPHGRWAEYQSHRFDGERMTPTIQANEDLLFSLWPSFERTIQKDGVSWESVSYSDRILRDWVRRKNPHHPAGLFRFHYNPGNVRTLMWKHPDSGRYFRIAARDTGALDASQWERDALLAMEDEKDQAAVNPEIADKGRRAMLEIADEARSISLKNLKAAKRTVRRRKSNKDSDQASSAPIKGGKPTQPSLFPQMIASTGPVSPLDIWGGDDAFGVSDL